MARILAKNTQPEFAIRRTLHSLGFRYRIHAKDLPGQPDIILPRYNTAIFVNGCFWHGHDCFLFRLPSTRTDFWKTKIERNRCRDREVASSLNRAGWRILIVWECAMRGPRKWHFESMAEHIAEWILGQETFLEIRESNACN